MNLLRISMGNRYLNMDFLVDAEISGDTGDLKGPTTKLRFAAPSPASVGACDWSVKPYEVVLKGRDAELANYWLHSMHSDSTERRYESERPEFRIAQADDDEGDQS